MLIGSVTHSIDAKGRYSVPAKFRADLGEKFILTEGIGGCLFAFTLDQWENVSRLVIEMPATDEETLRFKRDFFSRAYDVEVDAQSRVVLPPQLRTSAAIKKDIVTVGMANRLEIWDAHVWESYAGQPVVSNDRRFSALAGVVL